MIRITEQFYKEVFEKSLLQEETATSYFNDYLRPVIEDDKKIHRIYKSKWNTYK